MNKHLVMSILCWIIMLVGNLAILFLEIPMIHAFFYMYSISFGFGLTGYYQYELYKESKIKRWHK
jgi:hypothetical protein